MREIKDTDKNYKHKVFVEGTPLFSLMPKNERDMFVAILELEARDYFKGQDEEDGNNLGQPP